MTFKTLRIGAITLALCGIVCGAEGSLHCGPEIPETDQAQLLIKKVEAVYPPLARSSHVAGDVKFNICVSGNGTVQRVDLIKGHPLLVNAAKEAVLQYRYKPQEADGKPIGVQSVVTVNFTPKK